jgi:hypothetical protein
MSNGKITASLGASQAKETVYVDVDDEITGIIDRVTSSKAKVVALVLPKRAAVLQSIVNMKLLKRTAETAGKNLVLITSESSLLPLAGMVGLHVAATPTTKPEIPAAPSIPSDEAEAVDEPLDIVDGTAAPEGGKDFDAAAAAATPIGKLAADADDSILMTDDGSEEDTPKEAAATDTTDETAKPNKKLKVPSFNKFRLSLILGIVALILIITGWVFAAVVLPKAGVALTTDSTTINTDMSVTLDTSATTVDEDNAILPATAQSVTKTYSQDTATTGQKNNGQKASGTVTITNCSGANVKVGGGTSVTASSHTFITQTTITVPDSNYDKFGKCKNDGKATTPVVALKGGAEYNISASSATVSGVSGDVSAQTSAMTGGTDSIVKVVAQSDIDNAKAKLTSDNTAAVQGELESALKAKGLVPVSSTIVPGDQQVTTSVNVGDTADTVKVTVSVPYTMLGIKKDDLKTLVMKNVDSKIDTKKQHVTDDGIDSAKFSQQNTASATSATVQVKVRTVAGPSLDPADLRKRVAGKKAGEIKDELGGLPGVTDVKVAYSPFWVSSAPKNTTKITIIIDGVTK